MKFLILIFLATSSFAQNSLVSSNLLDGVIAASSSSEFPTCDDNLSHFIAIDYSTGEVNRCLNGSWNVTSASIYTVDADGDGVSFLLDEDDSDATDKGDSQLQAGNIRSGVEILDVTGNYTCANCPTYTERGDINLGSYTPSTSSQSISEDIPDGLYGSGDDIKFTIKAKTCPASCSPSRSSLAIGSFTPSSTTSRSFDVPDGCYKSVDGSLTIPWDTDIVSSNIRSGKNIYGVAGSYSSTSCGSPCNISKSSLNIGTLTPSSSTSKTFDVPDGCYDDVTGRATVTWDTDIKAGNIKSGVRIYNVTGSYTGPPCVTCPPVRNRNVSVGTISPGKSSKTIRTSIPDGSYEDNYCTGTVSGDGDLIASNIRSGKTIFGVRGNYSAPVCPPVRNRNVSVGTITPGKSSKTIRTSIPDGSYDDNYCTGTVSGDGDLIASNIRSGKSIFGVSGNITPCSSTCSRSRTFLGTGTTTVQPGSSWSMTAVSGCYSSGGSYRINCSSCPTPCDTKCKTNRTFLSPGTTTIQPGGSWLRNLAYGCYKTGANYRVNCASCPSHPIGQNISPGPYTPSKSQQTIRIPIPNGLYTSKYIRFQINGDADLKPSNIECGATIFGVRGDCP